MSKRLVSLWLCVLLCTTGLTVLCVFDIPLSLVGKVSGGTVYVGSGAGNATASIQDAIFNHANPGDTVFVFAGTYFETVEVNKTINLTGEDRDTTIIEGGGSGDVVAITANWVNITGFTIINGSYGLKISGASTNNNTISGVNVSSHNRCGISLYESPDNTISGNNITLNDRDGIYIWSSTNNRIAGNNFSSNNWSGISLEESTDNTISGNSISSHSSCGIYLWHSSNNTITDNDITNNTYGIFLFESSNKTRVYNNTFSNSNNGIFIKTASYNTITDNNFSNNLDGIDCEVFSNNNRIAGNNFFSNTDCAIELDLASNNNTVYGNNISNSTQGIYVSGSSNNTITFNNIYSNSDCGIFLDTASNNNTISGNNISDNVEGIYLTELFNNTIVGNNIFANSDCGIFIYTASNNNNISGNNITSNDSNGIYFDGWSYNNTIAYNNLSSNIHNGIYLSQSANNTITGNNITNNTQGIYLTSSSNNTVTCNIISSNNNDGIYLNNASDNTITENNITNNIDGIDCEVSSNNNTIAGNRISSNIDAGIEFNTASDNTISGNNISSNHGTGITFGESSNNTIAWSRISSNSKDGIYIWSSSNNTITGNNVLSNNWSGISLQESPYNRISYNNISLNNVDGIYIIFSTNNSIYHNNFINNTDQAFDDTIWDNQWDNDYPEGGNYWSDYGGVDIFNGPLQDILGSDWIGDTNYTIDVDSIDRYPLMLPTYLIPPVIRNVTADPDLQETGGRVNISCNVTDNFGVYNVWVNITLPDGGYSIASMTNGPGDQWFYNSTHIPLGLYQYTIWATDTDSNLNSSSGYSFSVQDTTLPMILNVKVDPDTQETGGWVNITCDVTDYIGVCEVWVNITLAGGGYINDSMVQGPGDLWYCNNTHIPLGQYQYIIWVNDTSNNWISSSGYSFTIRDTTLPVITNVLPSSGTQETGGWVNITCDVTDNVEVYDVRVNITLAGGGYINDSMVQGPGDLWYYNNTYASLGLYQYIIWANDTSNNWNGSLGYNFTIYDPSFPMILNVLSYTGTQESGGWTNITCDVIDNIGVYDVLVNFTLPGGGCMNVSMIQGQDDEWYHNSTHTSPGQYQFIIWANDSSNNWNCSSTHIFAILDIDLPEIINPVATPQTQECSRIVNVTVDVIDNLVVSEVWVNITFPDGSSVNLTMTRGNGDDWYLDASYLTVGAYSYTIWAIDSSFNRNSSQGHTFTIVPGPAFNIILISGDDQSGTVGTQLPQPLVIEVQDGFGNWVSNAMVWFNVTVGGGSLDISSPVLTDQSGRARANLTLGNTSGAKKVTTEIAGSGVTQVIFDATGEPGAPYGIMIVSGNNAQTGFIGTELYSDFEVEVIDRFGNLVPNAQVWFNVTAGGGSLDTTNPVLTDGQGRAQVKLTLGANAGTNTVTAEIGGGGIKQVIFTAFGLSYVPVIHKVVSNIELLEDDPPYILDLSTHAVDDVDSSRDLIWFITDSDNSLYTVSGQGTDTLVITTKSNEYGNDMVTLWVMDADGLQDSQSLWINITPVNDRPFFFPKPPALTITGDVPYMFDYGPYMHDVDNDPDDLSITTSDPDHTSWDGHKVTYTYPSSMIGQQAFLILTLSDGPDDASEVIQVNISHDNVPVVTSELPDITMYEDEIRLDVFDLDDYFDDPDGDAIYFSYGYSHINIKINENHSVDFISEGNWFGTETVTFRASDPDYAIAEDTITVIVLPRNDPPSISGVPDLVVRYNATYHFDLTPYISDIDNTTAELDLFFTEFLGGIWVRSEHIHVYAGNNLRMAINYSKDHLGTVFEVMIQVNDGLSVGYDVINITVSEDWPPELVTEIPDILFYEDERLSNHFNVHDHFSDPDGDALFYTYGQVHIGVLIRGNGSVDFYSDPNWYGTENITIRAADPYGGLAEDIITVTVLPVNDHPVLSHIPDQEGVSGETWILDIGPYISDVDNDMTEVEIECDSPYVIVAGTVLIFQYPVDMTGDTVMITATDPGNASASSDLDIKLTKAEVPKGGGVDIVQYILTIILIISILATILLLYAYQRGKYELEELFLVYGESGNLISNSYRGDGELENRDIMASMFTAVQDFISDAFDHEDHSRVPLKVMEIGDKKIMIERGKYTYLAAVFKGGTWRLASRIKKAVVDLEAEYADILEDWDGDMDALKGVQKHLDDLTDSK